MSPARPAFLFDTVPSLAPLITFWREAAAGSGLRVPTAAALLRQLEAAPLLQAPLADMAVVEQHRELVDALMDAVLPPARSDEACAAAVRPFHWEPLYATDRFRRLRILDPSNPHGRLKNLDEATYTYGKNIKAYSLILQQFYGVDVAFDYPLIYTTVDARTGLEEHYKLHFDPRFCIIRENGRHKALSPEELQHLKAAPTDLSLWMRLLPPERFTFEGFVLITAVDVTDQEVLSALKDDLLQKDAMASPAKIDHLQGRLRALLGCPELQLGLIALKCQDPEAVPGARTVGRSLLIGEGGTVPPCKAIGESVYAQALGSSCKPVIINDLAEHAPRTELEAHLLARGLHNLLLAPLYVEDRLVGLLELAAPRPGRINPLNAPKLMEAVMLFATALKRSIDEQEDRVQALIKEKYTVIHPVVEWRFREAALAYMEQEEAQKHPQLAPIVFPDVYPLYGLSDIRDSSVHRNAAIQADLVEQLSLAMAVVVEASVVRPLPILDELGYRISRAAAAAQTGPSSEDEVNVLDFLRQDVEPLFTQLETFGPAVAEKVTAYRTALDPELGILYDRRKAFEESVTRLTTAIGAYLDRQEQHAQRMFPHYFEKYKTDGVDYNIYVGASLLERGRFDLLHLQNLRLWQLMTMCGIVWELDGLRPQLEVPLSTTHLVLVQSIPLSIRFRQDEKRFDVDGAYNIRYELVKKRIDKARVRGSRERLTQPHQIAVVYAHLKEAQEYRRYIEYLQAAGYLTDAVEELELEDVQGLNGLKALRVTVQPQPPQAEVQIEPQNTRRARRARMPVEA